MIADMLPSHATHSMTYTSKKMPLFLERTNSSPLFVKDGPKRRRTSTPKIVQLSDEIVYIEGTVSVAF
jgi:hypothetical protein